MPPMYGEPNYDFPNVESDPTTSKYEDDGKPTDLTYMAFWYMMVLIILLISWLLIFFCLRLIAIRNIFLLFGHVIFIGYKQNVKTGSDSDKDQWSFRNWQIFECKISLFALKAFAAINHPLNYNISDFIHQKEQVYNVYIKTMLLVIDFSKVNNFELTSFVASKSSLSVWCEF